MSDPVLLEEILIQVIDSIQKIERRFSKIQFRRVRPMHHYTRLWCVGRTLHLLKIDAI